MCRKEHHLFGGVRAQCFPFFFITRLSCFYMNSIDSLKCMKVTKKNFQKKFLTVDHSAHMSMKDAAKCEN